MPHPQLHAVCDQALPHGGHHTSRSSSSSNYHHSPNPHPHSAPASPLVPPPPSPMDVDSPNLPSSDQTITTLDHISSLELALCSNFTCCSIKLPDLHALVEHFEEKHVVALNIDGKRIYPENTSGKRLAVFPPLPPSLSNSPSSSRSSSPPTPTIPLATAAFFNSDEGLTKNLALTASCGVYTPFSGMLIPPPDEDPFGLMDSLDTYPVMSCSPPSYSHDFPSLGTQASCLPSSPSTHSRSHDPMILNPDVIITANDLAVDYHHHHHHHHHDEFQDGEEKKKKRTTTATKKDGGITEREVKKFGHRSKADSNTTAILNVTAVSAKNAAKTKMRLLGGNNVKKREKAYRCPKVGCTKSYLNPNGLKYHLEKGTCHIELDASSPTDLEALQIPTPSDPSSSITNTFTTTATTPTLPSIELATPSTTTPRQPAPLLSPPYSLPFLKIENNIAGMQRNRTPCGNTATATNMMMMPTPPATPGSESPNCETNLPLPDDVAVTYRTSSPSSMISPSPISLPTPVAPTPISPTAEAVFLPSRMVVIPTTTMMMGAMSP